MADDVSRLRKALKPLESEAAEQPWAKERPWAVRTHIWWENELAVVDLHDLGAGLARKVVREALEQPADKGAVIFVHGRGRHSMGKTQVLRGVLQKELERVCLENRGMSFRAVGTGRMVWVSDPSKAPRWTKGAWSPGVWLWMLALLAAAIAALGHALGLW